MAGQEAQLAYVQSALAMPSHALSDGLPPVGVFWDIENCRPPRGHGVGGVVRCLRERFLQGQREVEFMCVCDTAKESRATLQDLNYAQVTVVHVNSTCKNAADDKLRQSLRRFAAIFAPPTSVVFLSGDVNFATELSDLRHRHGFRIILVHPKSVSPALIACAHLSVSFEEVVKDVPPQGRIQTEPQPGEVWVDGLPLEVPLPSVRQRLMQLSCNCGGRVVAIAAGSALLRFSHKEAAQRAQRRLDGEDVFGSIIAASLNELDRLAPRSQRPRPSPHRPRPLHPACHQLRPSASNEARHRTFAARFIYRSDLAAERRTVSSEDVSSQSSSPPGRSPPLKGPPGRAMRVFWNSDQDLTLRRGTRCWGSGGSLSALELFDDNLAMHGFGRDECLSAPPLPWKSPSPQSDRPQQKRSPSFRRTPGASRPSSRSSSHSSLASVSISSCRSSPAFSSCDSVRSSRLPSSLMKLSDLDASESDDLRGVGVEVMVSNLDYNISGREWRKILYAEFHQHVQILAVYVQAQPDNTSVGFVRVPSVDDARYLITQFHRKKIGYKRIHVSLVSREPCASSLRAEVTALLREVAGYQLPLVKFIELYEKRFYRCITVPDLFRLKDVVEVTEVEGLGRQVILLSPPNDLSSPPDDEEVSDPSSEWPICRTHCAEESYAEALAREEELTLVQLPLRPFAARVHTLLQTHNGALPLLSFSSCYAAEFGRLSAQQSGVPLEHLLSCVPGVKVALVPSSGIKKVQWAENKADCSPCDLSPQLTQFACEVVDLLRHTPPGRMPFSKFIPAYHHHFGKQCRVADYGYTRLVELFDAMPHVVQVLGNGSRRYVTLAHPAQVQRFASDLSRVLRSQPSHRVSVLAFPSAFQRALGKPFDIYAYGVCYLEDLLSEMDDSAIQVAGSGKEMTLAIPQRPEEVEGGVERTAQFAAEVVELLQHSAHGRMPFSKFIPAYHHHFGRQCRVASYGHARLIDLFHAIPHTVKLVEEHGERLICLTAPEQLKALERQVASLLRTTGQLPVPEFLAAFVRFHGHGLRLTDYGVSSVVELIGRVPGVARVESRGGRLVILDRASAVGQQLLMRLMSQPDATLPLEELLPIDPCDFPHLVELIPRGGQTCARLVPLLLFARDVRSLLLREGGRPLPLERLESAYAHRFGVGLVPASYGLPSVGALLRAVPDVLDLRGGCISLLPPFDEDRALRSPSDDSGFTDPSLTGEDESTPSPPCSLVSPFLPSLSSDAPRRVTSTEGPPVSLHLAAQLLPPIPSTGTGAQRFSDSFGGLYGPEATWGGHHSPPKSPSCKPCTPRKQRIAAKFNVPLSPARSDHSN